LPPEEIKWEVQWIDGRTKVLRGTMLNTTYQTVVYDEEGKGALEKSKKLILKAFLYNIPVA